MRRAIGSILILFLLGGLVLAYRGAASLVGRPEARADQEAGLSDPPNWTVELPDPRGAGAGVARYGAPAANPSAPPVWTRKGLKLAATQPTYMPRYPAIAPPRAVFLSNEPKALPRAGVLAGPRALPVSRISPEAKVSPVSKLSPVPKMPPRVVQATAPKPIPSQSLVAVPGRTVRRTQTQETVADQEHRDLLHHAQFLIKAGLAPVAKEPLQQIIRDVPGTPIAREASLTLDTIRN
jgi:hypothetical protein